MNACLAPQLRGQAFPLDWQGQVHSVFDHAVNIALCAAPCELPHQMDAAAPRLLTLLDSPRNMGERCLVVPAFALLRATPLMPGMPVRAEQGTLIAAHSTHAFSAYPVWKTTLVPEGMHVLHAPHLPLSCLADVMRIAGLTPHPAPWGHTLYQRMARWVAEEDLATQCAGLTALVGAGPGLTPAGDDMLVGWLCGRQIAYALGDHGLCRQVSRNLDSRDKVIRRELRGLLHTKPALSTDISRAFLEDALRGCFSRPLARLGRIVLATSQRHVSPTLQLKVLHQAVNVAARFGASSGRDGAYGLLLALTSDLF